MPTETPPPRHSGRLSPLLLAVVFTLSTAAPDAVLASPQRIIAASPIAAEIVCALGAFDRLVAVGASIAAAGAIGFIGLLVPHGLRALGVSRHRVLLPLSALGGGPLLVIADLAARTVAAPREIPVGVLTALCGAPFFAFLLHRRGRLGGFQ